MTCKYREGMSKECPVCHGKGYETIIKPTHLWKRPPLPESEQRFCLCRLRTGLTKDQVKILRKMK